MWWSMPETEARAPGSGTRRLALAGTIERQQRTVLTSLALADVQPNPDQPRKHFAPDKLAELADSIKARGLLQPIIVRRVESGYQLLAGERRFRAAQLAGLDKLPALIRAADDPLEVALIENLQREDLSPLEEAEGLALLIERHGYSHREVAELLGKSRPYVSNTLALTRLPDAVKADLRRDGPGVSRELLMGVAREEDPEAALALWRRLQLDLLSVRRFRAEKEGAASERPVVLDVLAAARRLNRALARLIADGVPAAEGPHLVRTLRRTERLVQRQLAALGAGGP
ncbi:MAG: ParB/RepB/Spo0J family partition protein [Deltaproteobacteria bacterium]|nr:MAG: ParB/RepB/Spo0J family partition protein [Deltaproteobacteria bacterium]TMA69904.1 MAG: ParB/RepB/Spo0J family partition protein [Deltaproteobacteria bacterium]TMB43464.1 MAG: ParB/RepB/Spo0J family partition protein [Deltaproteobacteria bacterium]